jgi:hypothetical protein
MYKITNTTSGEKIFEGSEAELVHFTRNIAVENEDYDFSIICLSEAKEYIEIYCDNLELTN